MIDKDTKNIVRCPVTTHLIIKFFSHFFHFKWHKPWHAKSTDTPFL